MFVIHIIIIALISILLALWSLRKLSHTKEITSVKEELSKGRVIYQRESESSS